MYFLQTKGKETLYILKVIKMLSKKDLTRPRNDVLYKRVDDYYIY